jgi:GNAT superfamily N-acetyltransferase
MGELVIRPGRMGDGDGCARVWLDAARHYAALDPDSFQVPDPEGLSAWFDELHAFPPAGVVRLVAVLDGAVVGLAAATLLPPAATARWQLQRGMDRARVTVDALAVASTRRRAGIGSALLAELESWATGLGAVSLSLDTYAASPLSVPFYDQLPGYTRHGVLYRKGLNRP